MLHVLCCSGGKDSVATGLLACLNKEPLDLILYAEVMYDNGRGISGESEEHQKFILGVLKPFFESKGVRFEVVRSESDYLTFFRTEIRRATRYDEHNGMFRGFPLTQRCGIMRDLKLRALDRYIKTLGDDVVRYIGYAADEPKRLKRIKGDPSRISLLDKYGYTEADAKTLCEEYGLLSPQYSLCSRIRSGCWMCCNAKVSEHVEIACRHPDIWEEFCSLEDTPGLAGSRWSLYHGTLAERNEEVQRIIEGEKNED